MQLRQNVRGGGAYIPKTEFNADNVYHRFNIRTVTIEDDEGTRTEWEYDEYFMTSTEYHMIQVGRLPYNVQWTDELRSIERETLYGECEKYISKYSQDATDSTKLSQWIEVKRQIRASPAQQSYPQEVTYPVFPE